MAKTKQTSARAPKKPQGGRTSDIQNIEADLWSAADELRANTKLKSSENAMRQLAQARKP